MLLQFLSCPEYGSIPSDRTNCMSICCLCASSRGGTHKSLKVYLSAPRFFHISQFGKMPQWMKCADFKLSLEPSKELNPSKQKNKTRTRLPITPAVLTDLHSQWNKQPPSYNHSMLWAASWTCFFGVLRYGEAIVPSFHSYDPHTHLSLGYMNIDSTVSPRSIHLLIKASKTNPFWIRVNICMGKMECLLCPVPALLSYIERWGLDPGPLFKEIPLSNNKFVQETLKAAGYDEIKYAAIHFV